MASSGMFASDKGELGELKSDLRESDGKKAKKALRRMAVLASMSASSAASGAAHVSVLLPDVLHLMGSKDLEMKKAVYLYLAALTASSGDAATMAFNRMARDATGDEDPLVRGIALRTLTSVKVESMCEGMEPAVSKSLDDRDPFVRKTAAICVAKLFDLSPEVVLNAELIPKLLTLLGDANPHVVANAAAALNEMQQRAPFPVIDGLDIKAVLRLLVTLNESIEWCQVALLDFLVCFTPKCNKDALQILERVAPRLNHSNSAVVLSAINVMLHSMEHIRANHPTAEESESASLYSTRMSQPLSTLMTLPADQQYICLRNLKVIIQLHPGLMAKAGVEIFFCKYNDPSFIKMEKIEAILALTTEENATHVLSELKEYAVDVDVDFAGKAVRAIGRLALNFPGACEACVEVLLEVINNKNDLVLQQAIVVTQDVFRKYPNEYESIIGELCSNLEELDDPAAKAALVWIIGEYSDRIIGVDDLLSYFVESFLREKAEVQLATLTAAAKVYLNVSTDKSADCLQDVLAKANENVNNPDVRERGLFYWRLLAGDLEVAREVVLAIKPPIERPLVDRVDSSILGKVHARIPRVSATLQALPSKVVSFAKLYACSDEFLDELHATGGGAQAREGTSAQAGEPSKQSAPVAPPEVDLLGDLMTLDVPAPAAPAPTSNPFDDMW